MVFPVSDPFDNEKQVALRKACMNSLGVISKHRKAFLENSDKPDFIADMSASEQRVQFGMVAILGTIISVQSRLPDPDPARFVQEFTPYKSRNLDDPLAEIFSTWPGFDLKAYVDNAPQPEEFLSNFSKYYGASREIGFEFRKINQMVSTLERDQPGAARPIYESFEKSAFIGIDPTAIYQSLKSSIEEARKNMHDNENEPVM
jgi:hypothetical protein